MENIEKKIKKLDLKQNAIKILINSIYGAFGNKWFYFYNPDIAQSITLQGQDLIKFSIKAVNHYFREKWHNDRELHEKLGIAQYKINPIDRDAAIYTDTDSIYVQFDSAISSIEGAQFSSDEALNICIAIDRYRLAEYFNVCFEKYGGLFNTKNRQNFELENLSVYGFWLKKKNYAIKVAYTPNKEYALLPEEKRFLVIKGLEQIKSSYPDWARKKIMALDTMILEKGKTLDLENDLIPELHKVKKEFMTLSTDEVAFNFRVRVYNKYVASEKDLDLKKGISIYPRAAAYHNHMLIKSGLNKKYNAIREGDKIKFYHCAENEQGFDVFAYSPENYPAELAPPHDTEKQFFSLIVDAVNRRLEAMGLGKIDENLKRAVEVIEIKTKKVLTDADIYPLYIVNSQTLEQEEVPEKFWKIIGNPDKEPDESDFSEYLETISKFGLNTVIVPKFELPKYIKKIERKLEKLALAQNIDNDTNDEDE